MNVCNHCKKEFEGRTNQKFCSVKCKNAYHNSRVKEKEAHIIALNRRLHKNWVALAKLYEIYRSQPIKEDIARSFGFTNKYHTHIHNSPNGQQYVMVYDYGYKKHIDDQIQIVHADI